MYVCMYICVYVHMYASTHNAYLVKIVRLKSKGLVRMQQGLQRCQLVLQ